MVEQAILTQIQYSTLEGIVEDTDFDDGWCNVSGLDKHILAELEREAYIQLDGNRARVTAPGRLALENHVISGTPEHGQLLLKQGLQRKPAGPYEGIMRRPGKDVPARPETLAAPKQKTCKKAGCFEPCMVSSKGKELDMCVTHQREFWREQSEKQRARKQNGAQQPVEPKKAAVVVEQPAVTEAAIMQPVTCSSCEGCVHREVLDMLRAKYPKIDELVEAMEAVRALQADLGIQG